jgi:enterochelin esterase-like enzyme
MTDSSKPRTLSSISVEQCTISSEYLERDVIVDVYLPAAMVKPEQLSLLLINDGQDL